jgi:hypothetical protein
MKTKLTGLALATMMAIAPSAQAGEVEVVVKLKVLTF